MRVIVVFIAVIVLVGIGLKIGCRVALFHPSFDEETYNFLSNDAKYEFVEIPSGNNSYTGWLKRGGTTKTIIYFGGNAESSSICFFNREITGRWNTYEGYNYLMIDYPKYGASTGHLNEKSIKDMVDKTLIYVLSDNTMNEELIIEGYSMGTGPAIYAASIEANVNKLILVSPYDDMKNVFNYHICIFKGPITTCLPLRFKMQSGIISAETLIIASKHDDVIPYDLSRKVADNIDGSEFVSLETAPHGEMMSHGDTNEYIKSFLSKEQDD